MDARGRLWQALTIVAGAALSAYVASDGSPRSVTHVMALLSIAATCGMSIMGIGLARRRAEAARAHSDECAKLDSLVRGMADVGAKLDEHGEQLAEHTRTLEDMREVVVADGELNISNAHSRLVHDATKYTCDRASADFPHGWCTQDEQDGWFRDYGIYERRCSQMGVGNDVLDGCRQRMLSVRIRGYEMP